jgi:ParB family transcriptional regulator, chromosome partitioning protein
MSRRRLLLSNNPLLAGPALEERQHGGSPYRELLLSSIDRDPNQPRTIFDQEQLEELARSIRAYGVLSPIIVQPGKVTGRYQLVAGERRLRASQLAGLTTIPALVKPHGGEGEEQILAIQLVENLQRSDLKPLERAQAIGALRDSFKLSVREIADRLGVSKSMVQRSLDILNLPDDLLSALKDGAAESKVLLLAKIEDVEIRASYLKDLDVLTRSQLEKDVAETERRSKVGPPTMSAPEDERIAGELQQALGLKVRIMRAAPNGDGGRVVVDFYSDDDLQDIFRRLMSL